MEMPCIVGMTRFGKLYPVRYIGEYAFDSSRYFFQPITLRSGYLLSSLLKYGTDMLSVIFSSMTSVRK